MYVEVFFKRLWNRIICPVILPIYQVVEKVSGNVINALIAILVKSSTNNGEINSRE